MNINGLFFAIAVSSTAALAGHPIAWAQNEDPQQDQTRSRHQVEHREQIYGSQLMTEQERKEHQERMRSLTSQEERDAYRAQHREEMQRRAREQGVDLPEEIPGKGKAKGKAKGAGKGYAPGYSSPGQGQSGGKGGGKGR
jgi:hypothetical protein